MSRSTKFAAFILWHIAALAFTISVRCARCFGFRVLGFWVFCCFWGARALILVVFSWPRMAGAYKPAMVSRLRLVCGKPRQAVEDNRRRFCESMPSARVILQVGSDALN